MTKMERQMSICPDQFVRGLTTLHCKIAHILKSKEEDNFRSQKVGKCIHKSACRWNHLCSCKNVAPLHCCVVTKYWKVLWGPNHTKAPVKIDDICLSLFWRLLTVLYRINHEGRELLFSSAHSLLYQVVFIDLEMIYDVYISTTPAAGPFHMDACCY